MSRENQSDKFRNHQSDLKEQLLNVIDEQPTYNDLKGRIESLEAELLTARTEVECLAGSLESVEGRLERVRGLPERLRGYGDDPICYGQVGAEIALLIEAAIKGDES